MSLEPIWPVNGKGDPIQQPSDIVGGVQTVEPALDEALGAAEGAVWRNGEGREREARNAAERRQGKVINLKGSSFIVAEVVIFINAFRLKSL